MFRLAASFLIAIVVAGCESVPDVTFGDGLTTGDGGNASLDATIGSDANGTIDGGPNGDDDSAAPPADTGVDAPLPFADSGAVDSGAVDSGAVNTCPKSPPKGATACCNTVACSGQCNQNDCFRCGQCGSKMLCCPDKKFSCVPLGSPCPP